MAQPGKVHYKKTQEILDNYLKNYHKELVDKQTALNDKQGTAQDTK